MILSMTKHLLQVDQGPNLNNIHRGVPGMMKTWMIFLPDSTNEYGLGEWDLLSKILLYPMIAFAPCRELMSFPSGVLDVGCVYFLKLIEEKYLTVY